MSKTIYEYVQTEENNFAIGIDLDGWEWSMKDHIKTSFYYKHGRLLTGNTDDKPVKNITKPLLDLQYRTEDLDVKDIFLFIDDPDKYHLSFLVKKYHDEVYVKEHNIDEFLDDINESRVDYGGGLSMDVGEPKPAVVNMRSISFCDQTDLLNGNKAFIHYFTPSQLKEMEKKGWGNPDNGATITIDQLIQSADNKKDMDKNSQESRTSTNFIEVYQVHGDFVEDWLEDNGNYTDYSKQLHFIAYARDENDNKVGVTLFKSKDIDNRFKLILRDKIFGRALGWGGAEELFEDQVWTNYDVIRIKDMIDAASKTIMKSTDPAFNNRNKVKDMDNLETIVLKEGTDITQVDTFPRNVSLFERAISDWQDHAQQISASNDSILGKNPSSGTPFKLQELVTQESRGLHDYRRGQFAKWVEGVYRDWILPYIIKEIGKGKKFISTLDLAEMQTVVDGVVTLETNKFFTEKVLRGEPIEPGEREQEEQRIRDKFMEGNEKFIEILKDELKNLPIKMGINIAGKQKDLISQVDKLVNVFRQIASSPQILDDPRMTKILNQILEASGLEPVDFAGFKREDNSQVSEQNQSQQQTQQPISTEALKQLTQ